MFTVKEVESKVSPAKKNIKITNVRVSNGQLIDEEGSIVSKLEEALGSTEFTIKITLDLPVEE